MNKKYASIYTAHFGKIASNMTILGLSLMIAILLGTILSMMFSVLMFFLAIAIIVATLGLIFLSKPNFLKNWLSNTDGTLAFAGECWKAFPYIWAVTLAMSIVSLVTLCLQKEERTTGRIVFSSIMIGLSVVLGIIYLVSGGNN